MARKLSWRRPLLASVLLLAAVAAGIYFRPLWFLGKFQSMELMAARVSSRKVVIDGHKIHYYVRGPENGRAIVLVHGLGGRSEDWMELAPYLVQAGYRVYTPDLLGFGQSEEPADATYSIPDQAKLVVQFFDAMQLRQPDLIGLSMGGWIAQKVAVDHPERVRRLVLVDSVGLNIQPDWNTRLFTPTTPLELDELEALLMPSPPKLPGFVVRDVLRVSAPSAWVIRRALTSMLAGKDVMDARLPSLKMPVLIVWGELDRIAPLSEGRTMHGLIPQSRLEIVPHCGHLAAEQCVPVFAPGLVRFLVAEPPLPASEQVLPPAP